MGQHLRASLLDEERDAAAKLALGGLHHVETAELAGDESELLAVVRLARQVAHRCATLGQFEGEMALVRRNEGQLLLVLAASVAFRGAFHHDHPERLGTGPPKGPASVVSWS